MEQTQIYRAIHYLISVRNATAADHKTLLQNITRDQLLAIGEVAKRLTNGHINPLRRGMQLFSRRRLMLRSLASPRVSVERKKRLVDRYHSVVPSMLKIIYLIQTIVNEVKYHRSMMTEFYLYLSSRDSLDIRKNNTPSEFGSNFQNRTF